MEAVNENEDGHELVHENSSTRILVYRLRDPDNSIGGGRTGSVAVKVLAQQQPDPARLKVLLDEFELSSIPALSSCSAVRAALRRTKTNDGSHAIWMEWAEGVTLRKWRLDNVSSSASSTHRYNELARAVRLARAIAGAIAEMHDAGVVLSHICDTNIIVHDHAVDDSKCDGEVHELQGDDKRVEFSVKMIDLGSAVLLTGEDPTVSMCAKQNDLRSLGAILYEIFFGEFPSFHQHSDHVLQSKVSIANDAPIASSPPPFPELELNIRSDGAPQCLAMVASKLMRTGKEITSGWSYQSAKELQQDLDHICDHPERFLVYNVGSGIALGETLEFPPKRLYGRTAEVSAISDAFDRVIGRTGRSEAVIISGASGTGKTALVHHMQEPLVTRGGIFVKGKFDILRQVKALSVISTAFTEYCESLLAKGGDDLRRIRTALQDVVGSICISVLIDLIPNLQRVMDFDHLAPVKMKVGGVETQHQLNQMFRFLARAISSKSQPLVLFLDDLQWADGASLDLMKSLIVDDENNILLIGSYRDYEVDASDTLSVRLDEIAALGVPITRIEVQNIAKDSMNMLVSETLRVPLSVSSRLAGIVQRKTRGNIFFAKQYLTTLFDMGLIRYYAHSRLWQWNLHQIESTNVANSAIGLSMQNIVKLPAETQRAIWVAACLGSHCDEGILRLMTDKDIRALFVENMNVCQHSSHNPNQGLAEALDIAVDRRLMGKYRNRYYFLHDQICQAALSLIPETVRDKLHRLIGMCIWKQSEPTKLEEYIFVAVDNLYLGSSLVEENEKIDLAQLYLRAGQKAVSLSLFVPASTYLKAGINLLGPGNWTRHYDLSLQLYKLYADTEYCNGGEIGYFVDQILINAKSFDHKLGAYFTLTNALGGRGRVFDALENNFHVLNELGESFPERESVDLESYTLDEWKETRDMLDEFSDETLITIKDMMDERRIWAMKFLNLLTIQTYLAEPEYLPLAAMRMVQLTVSHGIRTDESAIGFGWFGVVLCSQFDDARRGYQFGQLALKLLERSDSKHGLGRVYSVVYACINHWTEPLKVSLEPLLRSHHLALRSGDVEFGMGNIFEYCLNGVQSGVPLAFLEGILRTASHGMRQYKLDSVLGPTLVIWQFVLNLMGRSVDPLQLTGDAMDQEEMEKHWLEIDMSFCLCRVYFFRMWISYLYGAYKLAAMMAERSRNIDVLNMAEFAVSNHAFLDGMISLALARETKQMHWRIAAKKALKKVTSWSVHAPCNFRHKVALLEAEFASLEEEWGKAERAYEAAIILARENGFVQDQALACERAAVFHLTRGDQSRASEFYDKAYVFYMEWGALGKADHIKRCLLSMLQDDIS